ncbi:glycosyltransferase [Methylobacterium persicinum]|nr:hypothetical protein KHHGKMAE_2397 [Methylobacterium persicinum]
MPAKVKGHLDHEEIDTYSRTNADLAEKSVAKKKRNVVEVTKENFKSVEEKPVTLYSPNLYRKGPRIFVVTPYHKESMAYLRRCHESVVSQQVEARVTHVMVADGHARPEIDQWEVIHIRLPKEHGDNGNTPRGVGALVAQSNEAEFIAFLDADNWYNPDHLTSMLEMHRQTNADVLCSLRHFYDPEGKLLSLYEIDENEGRHVDTSCLMLHKPVFDLNTMWTRMPKVLSPWCDRIFFSGIQHRRIIRAYTNQRSVSFTTLYQNHYVALGLPIPENAKTPPEQDMLTYLQSVEGVRDTVQQLGFWPLAV